MRKKLNSGWTEIADATIRHLWACPDCKTKTAVDPDWYQANGTPVCGDCDCDMEYEKTEMKLDDRRLRELLSRIQAQTPFRVPSPSRMRVTVTDKDLKFIRRRLGITTYARYCGVVPKETT